MTTTDDDLAVPPASPAALASFPRRTLRAGAHLFRMHRRERPPFWFASAPPRGGGRYDLPTPHGACYLAAQPEAAFLETLARRPVRIVATEHVEKYRMADAPLPRDLEAANLPVSRARAFGLTAEVYTTPNYARTRAWARAFHAAGLKAILAIPRHDVSARLRTVTLLDAAGEHPPFGWRWTVTSTPVPGALLERLAAWGISVVPIPDEVPTVPPTL